MSIGTSFSLDDKFHFRLSKEGVETLKQCDGFDYLNCDQDGNCTASVMNLLRLFVVSPFGLIDGLRAQFNWQQITTGEETLRKCIEQIEQKMHETKLVGESSVSVKGEYVSHVATDVFQSTGTLRRVLRKQKG